MAQKMKKISFKSTTTVPLLGRQPLKGPDYVIRLKPDAKPYALSLPRRIPVPLL